MSYTYSTEIGDGVTVAFPFSFAGQDNGYLSTSNIHVYVAGVEVSFTILTNDPNKVYLNTAPPVGAEVLIRRIMPKNVPYSDFSRGNPFSQDTLNNTNLQQLYIVQEIFDGYLPDGFFFRTDIDMGGHKFFNLGDGVNPGDSVNFGQLKVEHDKNAEQDGRLVILEDAIKTSTYVNYISQLYVATGGEVNINTTSGAHAAALYINGRFQHKAAGAYMQTGGVVTIAEPLKKNDEVYLILGSDLPSESLYATIDDFATLNGIVIGLNTRLLAVENNYAKKGVNTDITSLEGLTVAIPVDKGGTGATTASGARGNLSAAKSGSNSDIISLTSLTEGITGLVTGDAAQSGVVGQILEVTATDVTLTTAVDTNIATLSLPAGEWDVFGVVRYISTGVMTSYMVGVTNNASLYAGFMTQDRASNSFASASTLVRHTPTQRLRLSAAATIYLRTQAGFSSGAVTATGYLRAERVR